MYESKYGTNKPSWVSVSQVYVLYPCNYDNKMIFDFDLTLKAGQLKSTLYFMSVSISMARQISENMIMFSSKIDKQILCIDP